MFQGYDDSDSSELDGIFGDEPEIIEPLPDQSPIISADLIDYLEARFPSRCPHIHEDDRTIWMNAGSAYVVSVLRQLRVLQEEERRASP